MAVGHALAPVHDLMKWHLYIGYCREDRKQVKVLLAQMKSFGLECFLRSSLDLEEQSSCDNIKQGMMFSHKCLLYVSQNYLNDPCAKQELKEAKRKCKFLGRNSVTVIFTVEKHKLEKYEDFQMIDSCCPPDEGILSNECLKRYHLLDYQLRPELSCVPKQNIGVGVAYTYFFGFLQMIVPGVRQKFEKEMEQWSIDKKHLVKRMLIVIRKTVQSPPKLAEPGVLEQTIYTIKLCADRSGREKREYTIPIYKLTADNILTGKQQDEEKEVFYFLCDLPACLYAIREAFDCKLANMSMDEVYEARNEFALTLMALLDHPDRHSEFANQWELLVWPDDEENPSTSLSSFLYRQITSKRLTESSVDVSVPSPVDRGSFRIASGISNYPTYREGPHYPLKSSNRGFCVIINNFRFENLPGCTRTSAETERLTTLFEKLKFKVCHYENLDKQQMMECLRNFQQRDHSESDAFACCLLSHGDRGCIVATDASKVSIVDLMKLMGESNCPGLKGKPKLFFIGACQRGGVTDGVVSLASVEPLQSDATPCNSEETSSHVADTSSPSSAEMVRGLIPPGVDFIVSYATLPGTYAWAHPETGGLYVDALCKHLSRDLELDIALRFVNKEVRKLLDEYDKEGKKYSRQDPFHIIMPPQKFLFLGSPPPT